MQWEIKLYDTKIYSVPYTMDTADEAKAQLRALNNERSRNYYKNNEKYRENKKIQSYLQYARRLDAFAGAKSISDKTSPKPENE